MAKLKVKSEKPVKVEKAVAAEEPETAVEKTKKKAKKPKSGDLEKNVKNVLKNGDVKSKKKDDILETIKDHVVKKEKGKGKGEKPKKKKKRHQKKSDDADKEVHEYGTETELPDELVSRDVILKAIAAAKEGIEKNRDAKETKELFDEELKYGLEVICMKIPNMPTHARRVCLKHSLLPENPDICLIVRDEKEDAEKLINKDHEQAIEKYEKILKKFHVTGIKTIIPLTKLKQDYGPHSLKIKLVNSYDLFLVEPEIADYVYTVLGKHFIQKRKRPIQVDFKKTSVLKEWIDKAKLKVSFKVSAHSNLYSIAVGLHKMDNELIADNVEAALEQLKEKFPGGWMNIRRIYYYPLTPSKIHIPIYYSKIDPNLVEVPVDKGPVQNRLDELAEKFNKKSKKVRVEKGKVVKPKAPKKPGQKDQTDDGAAKKKKKNRKRKPANKKESGEKDGEPQAKKVKQEEGAAAAGESPEKKKKKKNKNKKAIANGTAETPKDEGKENPETPKAEVTSEKPKQKKKEKQIKTESTEKPAANGSPAKKQKQKQKKKKPLVAAVENGGDD